ncbi:cache domain-containing protein [Desulfatibacillum aliphaticivorans]|uniref:cache domain-containing protein n=1 Tax=Desulfatibacillum aliphaticivorans TaxID=218208 RepID=UPI000413B2ED|nr:cache domain-containing protein [Desulfatibacillum aliphaticivorans]
MKKVLWGALLLLLAAGIGYSLIPREPLPDFSAYAYRDTRRMLTLVHRAAALIEEKGDQAFEDFTADEDKWTLDNAYLYVYALDGTNLYHGGYPDLVGRNLYGFTDLWGKKAMQMIYRETENPNNPFGWVHYIWNAPGSLHPLWKSSCNLRAVMPNGKVVVVGSGLDDSRAEVEFFRILVDDAVALVDSRGKAALPVLKSPESHYTILDNRVFVMNLDGSCLIYPGMDITVDASLFDYKDFTGSTPLLELKNRLEDADRATVGMLCQQHAGEHPAKMSIYGRLAQMEGQTVVVGAISPLPQPAWMN